MNPLGYINIFWLREFIQEADYAVNIWYRKEKGRPADWDLNFFDDHNFANYASVLLFYRFGLSIVFADLKSLQQRLVLDALATSICADSTVIWQSDINIMHDWIYEREIQLTDDPAKLFRNFYDLLAAGHEHSISEYADVAWHEDPEDTLNLYTYC